MQAVVSRFRWAVGFLNGPEMAISMAPFFESYDDEQNIDDSYMITHDHLINHLIIDHLLDFVVLHIVKIKHREIHEVNGSDGKVISSSGGFSIFHYVSTMYMYIYIYVICT